MLGSYFKMKGRVWILIGFFSFTLVIALADESEPYRIHPYRLDEQGRNTPADVSKSDRGDDLMINGHVPYEFVEPIREQTVGSEPPGAPALPEPGLSIDRWTNRDGLPHIHVRALHQSKDGYIMGSDY